MNAFFSREVGEEKASKTENDSFNHYIAAVSFHPFKNREEILSLDWLGSGIFLGQEKRLPEITPHQSFLSFDIFCPFSKLFSGKRCNLDFFRVPPSPHLPRKWKCNICFFPFSLFPTESKFQFQFRVLMNTHLKLLCFSSCKILLSVKINSLA